MPGIELALGGNNNLDLVTKLIEDNLNERTLILNNEINDDLVEDITFYIIQWNREDKNLPKNSRKPIKLFINSPGGDVFSAMNLIDIMLSSATPIYTIGLGMTASAAYYIYLAGKKRIAFNHSIFLQHDGETQISNSSSKARQTMDFFEDMEKRTKDYVLSRTNMEEDFYNSIYDSEYWMYADQAMELGVVTHIISQNIKFDEIL